MISDIAFNIPSIIRHNKPISIKESTRLQPNDEVYLLTPTQSIQSLLKYFCHKPPETKTIMIAGGGNIGSYLAQALENQYRTTLIEKNKHECQRLSEILSNTIVLNDDCTDKDILINENIGNTDLFCAMTNDDAVNIISSIQAEKLGAKQTFTLIKHPNYAHIMQHDHLNAIISPEQIAINQILKSFRQGDTSQVYVLQEGAIEVTEVTVHRQITKDSIINKTINEINLPAGCQIIGIIRKEKLLITSSASRIKSEDQLVIFIDNRGSIKSIENLF